MNHKPKCIIVSGRAGSGKTTLSKKLGQRLCMPVISRDEIKEGYVNTFAIRHDQLPPDTNAVANNFFFEVVNHFLTAKISLVIEAAFQHHVWEPRISKIAELGIPFLVVCSIDGEMAAKRHLQRGLDNPNREYFHGDKRVSIFRETGVLTPPADYVAPNFDLPTIHVSTEADYAPSLEFIASQILGLSPEHGDAQRVHDT